MLLVSRKFHIIPLSVTSKHYGLNMIVKGQTLGWFNWFNEIFFRDECD